MHTGESAPGCRDGMRRSASIADVQPQFEVRDGADPIRSRQLLAGPCMSTAVYDLGTDLEFTQLWSLQVLALHWQAS